ncbi:hypothetical protein DM01DRAFT_1379982 [Hesseltinella vesiculosa]|uniref:CAP-Gly domain-containing protein n=1 Tax=Hesseltinella vesiculosa TaxID=101127 RepID=A0A1X2GVT9_9FUNG|nr:hypothetical protein DM01DRAFT_1379982 [Hesseltinella vesiculosa]
MDESIGTRVLVQGKLGTIRYVGTTSFQTGKWIGIELDEPLGKNSGVVQGKRYFECRMNHGVFVRPSQVRDIPMSTSMEAISSSEGSLDSHSNISSHTSRFAPPHDKAASPRTSVSPMSSVLPSRIGSPSSASSSSRLSGMPSSPTGKGRPSPTAASRSSLVNPSRSKTIQRPGSMVPTKPASSTSTLVSHSTRPRSGTLGSSPSSPSTKELRLAQLRKLRAATIPSSPPQQQSPPPPLASRHEASVNDGQADDQDVDDLHTPQDTWATPSTNLDPDFGATGLVATNSKSSYGALDTILNKAEQTVPLKDYEELRLKLKVLEYKRQDDRERFLESEKVKEEAEQFLTLRNKLQDKVTELQKQVRDVQKENKDFRSDLEIMEAKYMDTLESLEMTTLDKEVAEERSETLQHEVNVLKDKMDEIKVDLDILQKDADILNQPPRAASDGRTPLEIVQLERHNERLKDALMRLRDASKEHETELTKRIKELEHDALELADLRDKHVRVKEALMAMEQQNEELKLRLDDALGAEEMVEQLAEKNLSLTEKIDEMHGTIDDLEALKDLADELEENHLETEKQLQAEIDHRDMLLREQMERLRSTEETTADYESTIQQFRELVLHLQSDLEKLRQRESQQNQGQHLSSQSQAMMSLNLQLQSTVIKAQAKTIDLELRRLDAMQASDKLSYIQPYLPDTFFKTENDAISCILLFKRLVFKAELIIKHLDQNHPISERITDTFSESLISVCELRQCSGWLADLAKRFVNFLTQCAPDLFINIGQVYHDLIGTERRMNGIVELLRTDDMNEMECVSEVQRIIAQLEHLIEVYLVPNTLNNYADQFFGLTRALVFNADKMIVEFTYVRQLVEKSAREEGIQVAEGLVRLDYDYLEPLSRLIVQAKSSKIIAKKLLRQLEDLSEQALAPKADYLHSFKTLYAISAKLSRFCFDSYRQIASYVQTKLGSKEDIKLAVVQQTIYNKADEILEIAESTMWEGALKTLKSLTNELSNSLSRLETDNKVDKIVTGTAPWIQRASDMKAEAVMDHDKDRKLQQHSEEIFKLIKDLKSKDQLLQESHVKVELLERRMINVKRQADQIEGLEKALQASQSQESMYSDALDSLQAEYDRLEKEHKQLKKLSSEYEEGGVGAALANPASSTPSNTTSTAANGNISKLALGDADDDISLSLEYSQQLEALRSAIRYLRTENAHLKSNEMMLSLKGMDVLPSAGSLQSCNDKTTQLRGYVAQSRQLVKELWSVGSQPKLVSLSERSGPSWQRWQAAPLHQYQTQISNLHTLKQRSDTLRFKMGQMQAASNSPRLIKALLNPWPKSRFLGCQTTSLAMDNTTMLCTCLSFKISSGSTACLLGNPAIRVCLL